MADVAAPYQDYARASEMPPFRGPWGDAWSEVFGLAYDVVVDAARKAVLARFVAEAPPDALPHLASERMLEPMPGEPIETWRGRLLAAWDAWIWAGTAKGVRDNVLLTGLTNVAIFTSWDWPSLAAGEWARFWVVVGGPHPWSSDGDWDDPGTWDDGGTWDSTASEDDVQRVLRQVRLWKPAHARCMGVLVLLEGDKTRDAATVTASQVAEGLAESYVPGGFRFAHWVP